MTLSLTNDRVFKSFLTANSDWGKILKTDDEGEKLRNGRTANRGWCEPGGHSADMKASEGGVNKSSEAFEWIGF